MHCISLEPKHLGFIKSLGYVPVGLGEKNFSSEWTRDNTGINISQKNKYYGEYTYHYWIWKNYLDKIGKDWIGFCQYRKFWSLKKVDDKNLSIEKLSSVVLKNIPEEFNKYDVILGEPFQFEQKNMKFIKRNFKLILSNPMVLFDKQKINVNFQFDLMHGKNNLKKAIDLLDSENKKDFSDFVNNKTEFNPHNMFICKSKKILESYYDIIFPWLERCESIFGFENLKGYGMIRIYGFLAERFLSYWFQKNTNYKILPIVFHDIRKDIY